MPNIFKDGNFGSMGRMLGSGTFTESNDSRVSRIFKLPSQSLQVGYFKTLESVSQGQTFEIKVKAKKISGNPRIWLDLYTETGQRLNSGNDQLQYIDVTAEDFKLYKLNYKVNDPRVKRIDVKFGFWSDLSGEVVFKQPHLSIVEEDYDNVFLAPLIIAQGIIGFDTDTMTWGGFQTDGNRRSIPHGVESMSWDNTTRRLTVNLKYAENQLDENRPLAQLTLYSKGDTSFGNGSFQSTITPVVMGIGHHRLIIWFVDKDNNRIDPATVPMNLFVNMTVSI